MRLLAFYFLALFFGCTGKPMRAVIIYDLSLRKQQPLCFPLLILIYLAVFQYFKYAVLK